MKNNLLVRLLSVTGALVALHKLRPKHHECRVARVDSGPLTDFVVVVKADSMRFFIWQQQQQTVDIILIWCTLSTLKIFTVYSLTVYITSKPAASTAICR